jgi:hypothetical protein
MNDLITIFLSGGLSLVLASALVFLARNWITVRLKSAIQHEYDQKLETHKASLKAENEISIEKLKAQLQITNVRFSHIFVKQAEVIAITFEKIIPLIDKTNSYIEAVHNSDQTAKEERGIKLRELRIEFHNYFRTNRIYITNDTAKLVHKFLNANVSYVNKNSMLQTMFAMRTRSADFEERVTKYGNEIDALDFEVNDTMDALVKDFQNILGIYKEEKKP